MSGNLTQIRAEHQGIFIARYEAIKSWAMKLAKGDRDLAEDLVHDAYVQFVLTAPPLEEINNLDGYLFGLLRNLCLSHYRQSAKTRLNQLSIFDYDSAQGGLSTIDHRDQEAAREDLKRLCAYLAVRKDSTKAACVFVMRFLLGYFPSEIATILRSSRAVVNVRMMSARNDLRSYLETSGNSQADGVAAAAKHIAGVMPIHNNISQDEFLWFLRSTIFEFSIDDHKSRKDIEGLHKDPDAEPVDVPWLSHLVSCPQCLDEVNTMFSFPKLNSRFPTDALNRESKPNGKSGDDGPPGSSGSGFDLEALARSEQRVREHEPRDIRVCVNGILYGSQRANASQNELKLNIPASERVEFVEVFSEQRVRLMMLSIPEAPPEGPSVRHQVISLSDGRKLSLDVEFVAEGAEISVAYTDPTFDEVQRLSNLLASDDPAFAPSATQQAQVKRRSFGSVVRPQSIFERVATFLRPGWPRLVVAGVIAIAIIGIWIYADKGQYAKAILEESEKQGISWEFEPGKVKHWVSEVETQGLTTRPDSKYLSYFWQNNIAGQTSRMIVHRNMEGQIEWGQWFRADGSQVLYETRLKDQLTVYPGYAQLEESMIGLDDASKQAVQKYIDYVKRFTDPQKLADGKVSYVRRMYDRGEVSTEMRQNDGKILVMRFRPADVSLIPDQLKSFDTVIEIRESDYRQVSFFNTKYFKDGRVEKTGARFLKYAESTQEEMENNDFTTLIANWPEPRYAPITEIVGLFKNTN